MDPITVLKAASMAVVAVKSYFEHQRKEELKRQNDLIQSKIDTLKGLHVEDRAWNLKKSAEFAEKEKIELHEAKLDSDAGRRSEAAEHTRLAASYYRSMEEYKHAASICSK